ncbi:MAG: cbb3-type cytochrome c oxidase subunit I, partial [Imperialibacter sp.]
MKNITLLDLLLKPKNWWIPLFVIFVISLGGLTVIGLHTYVDAPPIPNFVTVNGDTVYSKKDILEGQEVFHKYALMEYGSMFGDGALRGPDFTAEALHKVSLSMREFYLSRLPGSSGTEADLMRQGIGEQVKKEIKQNTYDVASNTVTLSEGHAQAASFLVGYYTAVFTNPNSEQAFRPTNYITDPEEIRALAGFFFWGAWVCGTQRPGKNYSYTHNWPFDPDAGNTSTSATLLWSIVGSLGLLIGLGAVLYYHGKLEKLDDNTFTKSSNPIMTLEGVANFKPTRTQKATYKFFAVAMVLFLLQVVAGILTVHDFVGFVKFWGYDISVDLPVTIVRSWHLQLSLLWISACWIGASFFVIPFLSPKEPKKQLMMVNTMFWLIVVLVAGSVAGIFFGPKGLLPNSWYWLGHQGWEYLEPGKIWQGLLYCIFIL